MGQKAFDRGDRGEGARRKPEGVVSHLLCSGQGSFDCVSASHSRSTYSAQMTGNQWPGFGLEGDSCC